MRACWASTVSACKGPITGEHLFPWGMFGSKDLTVRIGNSPSRRWSLPSFVANCLCARHNRELGPLDQSMIGLLNVLRHIGIEGNRRADAMKAGPHQKWLTFVPKGRLIERGFLKTFIDMAHGPLKAAMAWSVTPQLVEMVFGKRPHPDGAGLGMLVAPGQVFKLQHWEGDRKRFEVLIDGHTKEPLGAVFTLSCWSFWYSWRELPALPGLRRPFILKREDGRIRMRFDWSTNERPDPAIVALAKLYPAPER